MNNIQENNINWNNMLTADRDAFNAYGILFYDTDIDTNDIRKSTEKITASKIAATETVARNLIGTGYVLDSESLATLSIAYANGIGIDPSADIRRLVPGIDSAPMYPDFPSQVIKMSEDEYRSDQAMHYLSTYGVESLLHYFGSNIEVEHGWMPDTSGTDKTVHQDKIVADKVIRLVFGRKAALHYIIDDLSRPMRMSVSAMSFACDILGDVDLEGIDVAFHENMMGIIAESAENGSSRSLMNVCLSLVQHPGDIFKAIIYIADSKAKITARGNRNGRLTTAMKKGFCRALERFEDNDVARNIVDNRKIAEKAISMLSVARFGGPVLNRALVSVENGDVKAYDSLVEEKWNALNCHHDDKAMKTKIESELLGIYSRRPGVFLRSVARLVANGISPYEIEAKLSEHVDELSMATLVSICNVSCNGGFVSRITENPCWRIGNPISDVPSLVKKKTKMDDPVVRFTVRGIVLSLLSEKMKTIDIGHENEKIFVDDCGFSLNHSIILPNMIGDIGGSYPPNGMAYKLPDNGVVRTFVFWDDRRKRVDVDAHFNATMVDGSNAHIGWNGDYRTSSMVTSGDITTSHDSVEYIDIDLQKARVEGVDSVGYDLHIFCGAGNWRDIDTCFCGMMTLDREQCVPTVELYSSDNVVFHDDLDGDGTRMHYADINVSDGYLRILRGCDDRNAIETDFTLDNYLRMLLSAHNCVLVDNESDADCVMYIGRNVTDSNECLIDKKFFIE